MAILSGACGAGALLLLIRDAARGARALALVAVAAAVVCGGGAVAVHPAGEPDVRRGRGPVRHSTAVLAVVVLAALVVLPGFVLLYILDQRGLLPEEGVDDVADRLAENALDQRAR